MSAPSTRTVRVTTAVVAGAVVVALGGAAFGFTRTGGPSGPGAPAAAPTAGVSSAPATAGPSPQPTTTAPLQSTAPIASGLSAEIVSMRAVQAKATQPGQVGGPAVRFTIRLTNRTAKAVDLSNTIVNVYSGVDQAPAYQLDSDGLVFPTSLPAGRSVTGTAVFTLPLSGRDRVQVTVDTSTGNPVVAFTGAAPR